MIAAWLMKSEPDVFSLDDLKNAPKKTTLWEGVRNYQARNFMRDSMKFGDAVLFYHSNCTVPGIVGLAKVSSKKAYPDPSQFDAKSDYFDPKATPENPRWVLVDVTYVKHFKNLISLAEIKEDPLLQNMLVAKRGQRLSIQPVEKAHVDLILKRAQ